MDHTQELWVVAAHTLTGERVTRVQSSPQMLVQWLRDTPLRDVVYVGQETLLYAMPREPHP